MSFPRARLALALLLATGLAGCGGGGDDGTVTLTFTPASDGIMRSDNSGQNTGGLVVGDTGGNLSVRTGLRFAIVPFIPAGATVVSATLRVRQTQVVGVPYTLLGTVIAERVDFGVGIDGTDWGLVPLGGSLGTLINSTQVGTYTLDVTSAVQADLAANDFTSDFRLRFTSDVGPNAMDDQALLEDSENFRGSGLLPELIVVVQ
jgi:hypothetical protein